MPKFSFMDILLLFFLQKGSVKRLRASRKLYDIPVPISILYFGRMRGNATSGGDFRFLEEGKKANFLRLGKLITIFCDWDLQKTQYVV
ncbi:MAG: hypothetical protein J6J18_09375 [Oscillospiraceae bacterium]|nr:hypothetical protein [Oscillospiraceae bacterium]